RCSPPAASASRFLTAAASTAIDPLSLHDALPISRLMRAKLEATAADQAGGYENAERFAADLDIMLASLRRHGGEHAGVFPVQRRSEEHTSELQSRENLVCRLLLEKKKS